jgi:hypothetical protein
LHTTLGPLLNGLRPLALALLLLPLLLPDDGDDDRKTSLKSGTV